MPCHDYDADSSRISELTNRLHITTRLACEFCTILEKQNTPIPDYAHSWWNQHKAQDKLRKDAEERERQLQEVKRNILSKLTPDEIAFLKLK